MSMIGQERLIKLFQKKYDEATLPQFIMLVGQKGQGKRTLAGHLSSLLSAELYVPEALKVDNIREIIADSQTLHSRRIYLLAGADEMTPQAQNALLKFCEEPSPRAFIIMTVEHVDNVLSTIKSRASVFHLDQYTKEDLSEFAVDWPLAIDVCENVGQIERAFSLGESFETMYKTANTVVENIGIISAANAFNISKHFDINDVDLFIQMLLHIYTERARTMGGRMSGKMALLRVVKVIYKYKGQLKNKSINKQNALDMMFVEMREAAISG